MTKTVALVSALSALVSLSVAAPAFADPPAAPAPAPAAPPLVDVPGATTRSATVEPPRTNHLADIQASRSNASSVAGAAREVGVENSKAPAAKRPVAGVRAMRRMNVERALAAIAPQLDTCNEAMGAHPAANLAFQLSVAPSGEIERVDPAATAPGVPAEGMACVAVALRSAKLTAPGGAGVTVTVPVSLAARSSAVRTRPPTVPRNVVAEAPAPTSEGPATVAIATPAPRAD